MIARARSKKWSAMGLGAVLLAGAASPALAQSPPSAEVKAGARAAAERGSAEFQAGHYKEALDLILRAESLIHATTHLLMLGRTYAALGQLVQAKETFLKATREELPATAPAAFKRAQGDCEKELRDLERRIPSVQITVTGAAPSGLTVTMDGAAVPAALVGIARPVDPGKHAFRASAPGFQSPEKTVTVAEGEKSAVQLELRAVAGAVAAPAPPVISGGPVPPPPPGDTGPAPSSSKRIASFVLMGVGVGGIGVGAAFAGLYAAKRGEANTAFDKCGVGCVGPAADSVRALDSTANTRGDVAIAAFAAGGALAAAGVALFVVSRAPAGPTTATLTPWVLPGGAGVSGTF